METIRDRLLQPRSRGNIGDLHAAWFETVIRCRIPDYGKLVHDLGLVGRIRGAFGEVLKQSASPESVAGEPCPWTPPCAFEALFRKQGRMEPGLDFPSPWVIALDCVGSDLLVSLSLFGFSCDWAAAAADALVQALTKGVNWVPKRDFFVPAVRVTERQIETVSPPSLTDTVGQVEVCFITPVVLSSSSVFEKPNSLITTLSAKLAGLGRWHDLEIVNNREALRMAATALVYSWTEVESLSWTRGSKRQDRAVPMKGLRGKLCMEADQNALSIVLPILNLGTRCFAGADVAFGCGRFEIGSN
jgi:hypothetical protein